MTEPPRAGAAAPDFTLPSTGGDISLRSLLAGGRHVVLAFFFEAGTPTCEREIALLKDADVMIDELGGAVVAVSADPLEAQRSFAERLGGVPFPIASDADLTAARAYAVIDEGDPRRSRRAVFVIDRDGAVLHANAHFQPGNPSQVEAIFAALGAE